MPQRRGQKWKHMIRPFFFNSPPLAPLSLISRRLAKERENNNKSLVVKWSIRRSKDAYVMCSSVQGVQIFFF